MDRTEQIELPVLELEFTLLKMIKKSEKLLQMGCNDEKLNDKIIDIRTKIKSYANTNT